MPYIGKQPATISAVSVDTTTGTFSGQVAAASLDISGNVDVDGVLETDGLSIASTAITASAADINLIDGITNGTVIASKAIITDANKDISGGRNITISGELDAATLDISGNADIDGTLEADAITVNGTALNTVIAGVTVANATLAATTTVTDSTANTNFPVVFHDESNGLLDDTNALRYNPSTGELLVPKLTVAGVTTTADTVTMQAANAVVFEGATADAHETTLTITDPTADRTITLPNVSGTLPILAADSNTAITSTPAEINLLDGSVANTVVNSKAVVYGSSGELAGALSTAAQPNVTSLGTLTALTVDDITINGSTISDGGDFTLDVAGEIVLDADGGNFFFNDGGTTIGRLRNVSSDFVISSEVQDKDLLFKGNDGGSTITALTLDMSDAGKATFNSNVHLVDNGLLRFGASNDLQLFHDGTDSFIDEGGTGSLRIRSNRVRLEKYTGENMIECLEDGAVELYHNSNKKLETTSSGVTVTGGVTTTTASSIEGGVVFNEASADVDFRVESNGNTHTLFVEGSSDNISIGHGSPTFASGKGVHLADFYFIGFGNGNGTRPDFQLGQDTSTNTLAFRCGTGADTIDLSINTSGVFSGDFSDTSDERLKENIQDIADNQINIVKQLRPVTFDWKEDGKGADTGFIAQEVIKLLPNDVHTSTGLDDDSQLGINSLGLIATLTKALQEAITKIETLEAKVTTLENA